MYTLTRAKAKRGLNVKRLSKNQAEVLGLIIRESADVAPPIASRLAALAGRQVQQELRALVKKGYVRYPYRGAAYVAVRDESGSPIRWVIERHARCPDTGLTLVTKISPSPEPLSEHLCSDPLV